MQMYAEPEAYAPRLQTSSGIELPSTAHDHEATLPFGDVCCPGACLLLLDTYSSTSGSTLSFEHARQTVPFGTFAAGAAVGRSPAGLAPPVLAPTAAVDGGAVAVLLGFTPGLVAKTLFVFVARGGRADGRCGGAARTICCPSVCEAWSADAIMGSGAAGREVTGARGGARTSRRSCCGTGPSFCHVPRTAAVGSAVAAPATTPLLVGAAGGTGPAGLHSWAAAGEAGRLPKGEVPKRARVAPCTMASTGCITERGLFRLPPGVTPGVWAEGDGTAEGGAAASGV